MLVIDQALHTSPETSTYIASHKNLHRLTTSQGLDLDCGDYSKFAYGAVKNGLVAEEVIDRSLTYNVVELIGYCVDGGLHFLAYEFATMGSLHDILHGRKGIKGAQPMDGK